MTGRAGGGRRGKPTTPEFAKVYGDEVFEVYGFFAYRLRSREEAEDLTQATFERALKAWSRFDPRRASSRTWLLAIARNLLADHHRRGRASREELVDVATPDGEATFGASDAKHELGLSPALEAALGRLGERPRELIALRFGADLTGPQIAELTELSLANVQQILSRALRALRDELERSGDLAGAKGNPGRPRRP